MPRKYYEQTFTPSVLAAQDKYYGHSRPARSAAANDPLGPDEEAFIAARDSFYLASVTESGWPYIQHRGGPAGFLHVLDPSTLGFADYPGNHQMISTGNIAANDRVSLFLMDYPTRTRLKILGHARVEAPDRHPDLARQWAPAAQVPVKRIFFIDVVSFDWNCPKYITPRYTAAEVEAVVAPLQRRIAELEADLARHSLSS